jgi:hypothetical protein
MKKWMLAAAAVPLVAGLVGLVAVIAALQPEPSVSLQPEPVAEDVARALALVRAHDPRHATPGRVNALRLSERVRHTLFAGESANERTHVIANGIHARSSFPENGRLWEGEINELMECLFLTCPSCQMTGAGHQVQIFER